MFVTALTAALLGSTLSPGTVAPAWKTDYREAMTAAAADGKPVAVFIGKGDGGFARVVAGEVPAEAGKLLAAKFVCLYVNTDTAAGKDLAGRFGMAEGLVVSSKGGEVQALKHAGAVAPAALTGYLTKYSDPARVVTATERVGVAVTAAPVVTPAAYAAPAPVYAAPVYRTLGGCPNGRCPNAR